MTDDQERSSGRTRLEKQAAEIVDADTEAIELVRQLDYGYVQHNDEYADWHTSKPLLPMVRAHFLKELEGYSIKELHDHLDTTPADAATLGFDDVPSRTTFGRAWRDRFDDDLQHTIEFNAKQIRELAAERGNPIGGTVFGPDDTGGSSKRTEQRLLRRKTRDVLEEMEDVVFPALSLDRTDDPVYDEDDLLTLETLMAIKTKAANNGGDIYGDLLAEENEIDLDAPFYEDGPTGETLLEELKELTVEEITAMHNRAATRILTRAKPYTEFPRPVMLAIDMTYVGYYGERDEMLWVQGAPDDKEYDWCHKFATASIIGDNIHFTVAMLPVGNPEERDTDAYPGEDRSYRVGEVVRELLARATQHISIDQLVADREFHAADTVIAAEEHDVRYVIPVPRNKRIKRELEGADDQVTVKEEFGIYGPVKGKASNTRAETTLVILPTNDNEERDEPAPFITNSEVDDEIGLDRRRTKRKIQRYNRRGGIENTYKKIKEFAA